MNSPALMEPQCIEGIGRESIFRAFCIEFDVMMDRPAMQSKELRAWMIDEGLDWFARNGDNIVRWGIMQHPIALAITATVAAAMTVRDFSKYKDYSANPKDFGMALTILVNAKMEDLASLSLPVAGGLLRFVKEVFIDRFSDRYSSLKALPIEEKAGIDVAERIKIYEDGLKDSVELEANIFYLVNKLEAKKNEEINAIKVEEKIQEQKTHQEQSLLEARYKAGVISHEEYRKKISALRSEKFAHFAGKATIFGLEKFNQLSFDPRDLEFFCREFFPDFFIEEENAEQDSVNAIFIFLAIFAILLFVFLSMK